MRTRRITPQRRHSQSRRRHPRRRSAKGGGETKVTAEDAAWLHPLSNLIRQMEDVPDMAKALEEVWHHNPNVPVCGLDCKDLGLFCRTIDYWDVPEQDVPLAFWRAWFGATEKQRMRASETCPFAAHLVRAGLSSPHQAAWTAASTGNLFLLRTLQQTQPPSFLRSVRGGPERQKTLADAVARRGDRAAMEFLLGPEVGLRPTDVAAAHFRLTAHAVRSGNVGLLQLLVAHGFSITDRAADIAAQYGHVGILDYLYSDPTMERIGFEPELGPVISAVRAGHVSVLEWFAQHAQDVDLCAAHVLEAAEKSNSSRKDEVRAWLRRHCGA